MRTAEGEITVKAAGVAWTSRRSPGEILRVGDIAWFRQAQDAKKPEAPYWMLEQEPQVEGAAIVLESATGAIRAMVGGWDFRRSRFNRANQAMRQAGSSFKPFVFGAALENGFTPADTLFDAHQGDTAPPQARLGLRGSGLPAARGMHQRWHRDHQDHGRDQPATLPVL